MKEITRPADAKVYASSVARRSFIKSGLGAAGAVAVAATSIITSKKSAAKGGGDDNVPGAQKPRFPPSPVTTPFKDPLFVLQPIQWVDLAGTTGLPSPMPSADSGRGEIGRARHQAWGSNAPQKYYEMHVREADHRFHSDMPTSKIWGFNGQFPGPLFHSRYGTPELIRIYNDLPQNIVGFGTPQITTHLHNMHTPSESDGFPGDWFSPYVAGPTLTAPGYFRDHHYPMVYAGGDPREALGTLWYHDHTENFTAPNVYRGMAGFHPIFDEIDSGNEQDSNSHALRLPSGAYDVPLMFMDFQFDTSGAAQFDTFGNDGMLGDKFTVNGVIQPYFQVEPRKYRFRMLAPGPSRFYEFYLVNNGVNQQFTYISNDGNLLPAPIRNATKVRLGVAERADIVIDFSKYPMGTSLFIVNKLEQLNGRGPTGNILQPGTQMLRFDIVKPLAGPDYSQVPDALRALPDIDPAGAVAQRSFTFKRTNAFWSVNDRVFDVNNPLATPKRGTSEIWTLSNQGDWSHPVHIHFEEGRILQRNGVAPPLHEQGRKDVYVLPPNSSVKVYLRFRDFVGKYACHCHNVVHEDHAMMFRWDIVD